MGTEAVGTYLRALRETQRVTRNVLAQNLNTSVSLIESIERGQTDTRGSLLLQIVHTLQGSPEQLLALMINPDATLEEGRKFAEAWIKSGRISKQAFSGEVATRTQELAKNPILFQRWLGYADRLLEEIKGT